MVNNMVWTPGTLDDNLHYTEPVSDGAGGSIVFFVTEVSYPGPYRQRILAQRISATGNILWGDTLNAVVISEALSQLYIITAVADGTGGAFIAWPDYRHSPGYEGEIYAQHIDSSGNILWPADGLRITNLSPASDVYSVSICTDGNGGLFLGYSVDNLVSDWQTYAQHLDAAGNKLWGANGLQVCAAPGFRHCSGLVRDNNNGVICLMGDSRNDVFGLNYDSLIEHEPSNMDIYGQRLDAAGNKLWAADGVPICNVPGNQDMYGDGLVCGSDGDGGAYMFFEDWRNDSSGTTENVDIYGQRVNASGNTLWGANGLAICTAPGNQFTRSVAKEDSALAICWADVDLNSHWSQRVNITGQATWAANGIRITDQMPYHYQISVTGDSAGNFVYGYATDQFVRAQKIDPSGSFHWGPDGTLVSAKPYYYNYSTPELVTGPDHSVIFTWVGLATSIDPSVIAAKLLSDGSLSLSPGETYFTTAGGNWNNPAIWAGNKLPPANAVIVVRHPIIVTANTTCYSLKVEPPSGSVTVKTGVKLTVVH